MVDTTMSGEIVLVRHGETVGESSIRLYGATDIALSEFGAKQLATVGAALAGESFANMVVSPLQRSRRSGEIVRTALQTKPPVEVVREFSEINFGAWEGWTFAEAAERDPEGFARRARDGDDFGFPGGETRRGFYARVAAAVTPGRFPADRRTLVVVHKGIIKILISVLCGVPYAETRELPVALGSIHRLRPEAKGWRLVAGNLTEHLGELDIGG